MGKGWDATLTSITELGTASSSEAVFLAEPCSYLDDLVCFVRLLISLFCTVAVLWAACTDLLMALKSGYSGHLAWLEFSWSGTEQNIISLMFLFIWWHWKMLQSVWWIKFSVIRSRAVPVTCITVLLLYNILWQKVQNIFWTRIDERRASIIQTILDLDFQKSG